jgi:drug/metabolite transporter (DMT)-like permease
MSRSFKLTAAFACIYVVWGSTYLAIRYGVEAIPPFAMAGVRFLLAGGLLYAWLLIRGQARRATAAQWKAAAISGTLFFAGGNGGVCWAERLVSSSIAALVIGTMPLWIVLVNWLRPRGERPTLRTLVAITLGFFGVALLVGPSKIPGTGVDPAGVLALLIAEIAWAIGTVYTRFAPRPANHLQSTAMQMLAGGAALCAMGVVHGDWTDLDLSAIPLRSVLSVAYLVIFGSIVAFSAYNWLVHATTPSRLATYAYVNPVIAVLLGWSLGGEAISSRMLLAGAIIVVSVAITLGRPSTGRSPEGVDS